MIEESGLNELVADLTRAGLTAGVKVAAVFEEAGPGIRDEARNLAPKRGLPHYAKAITHDVMVDGTTVTLEVGPERGGQGSLGHLLEVGTVRTPPHAHLGPAFDRGAPPVVKRLGDVLGDL